MTSCRRLFATLVLGSALVLPLMTEAQGPYPNRPVALIVPSDAGSSLDLLGRTFANALGSALGQPVVVQNVPGVTANGLVRLHGAKPDGYTIGVVGSFAITTPLSGAVSFGPTDLSYLAYLTKDTFVLAVPASSPYRTLRDYMAAASGVVPAVVVGVSGKGTLSHVAAASMAQVGALNLSIVPSAGSMASLKGILDGRLASAILVQTEVAPPVDPVRGPRVLATFGDIRLARLPDVPTANEQNMSGLPSGPWRGLAGPPGLPQPIRAALVSAVSKASEDPQWKRFVQGQDLTGSLRTGAELERYLEAERGALRLTMQSLGLLAR
jgi:tripartite-type tricarboxylate transporter receptor subunit TctC